MSLLKTEKAGIDLTNRKKYRTRTGSLPKRKFKLQTEERHYKGDYSCRVLFSNAVYHLKLSKEWRGDKSEDSLCASFLIEVKRLRHEIYFIKEVQI